MKSKAPHELPSARIKREATISLIWLVPVLAAIVAAVLVFENFRKIGPAITIQFDDGTGLDANQTVLRYRGVRVGSVKSLQLTPDTRHVLVKVRLDRTASGLARDGTIFWVVRPEVGAAGFHALDTIVSGPYIQAMPRTGNGKVQKHFIGASEAPVVTEDGEGVEFVLRATQIRSLGPSSPVYYRGVQAGKVEYLELSSDATGVNIHVRLKPSFAPLVRSNTVWWNAGGISVDYHFLLRFTMSAENLRAVLTGGIAFATPDEADSPAPPGTMFAFHEKAEEQWLSWSPRLSITNATVSVPGNQATMDLNNVGQSQKQQ